MEATAETERHCDLCDKTIRFGHASAGVNNWDEHVKSQKHQRRLKETTKTRAITSFFAPKTKSLPAESSLVSATRATDVECHTPNIPSSSSSSPPVECLTHDSQPTSQDVECIAHDIPELESFPNEARVLLARLRSVILTLPSTVGVAENTDILASFAVDPTTLVQPGQDAWEDVIHDEIDTLMYDGGRSKNNVELSQSIRRGELGMLCLADWLEKCLFQLKIPLGMLERRIERLIDAMVLLGASEHLPPPSLVSAVHTPQPTAKKNTVEPRISLCPGQELPLKEGKSSFLSYALGIHAERSLPWNVEFGSKLVVRSHECKVISTDVCYPCQRLLRHPVITRMLERNEDGIHPNTPFAYLTIDDTQNLLHKKNAQINGLKLAGLSLGRTLLRRATHLEAYSRLRIAISRNDVPRIHAIVGNDLKHGASIFKTLGNIGHASDKNYHPKSYSHAEHQLLYLLLQLGGHAAADLGHRCLGLPSINATKRHIATKPLTVSPRSPLMKEMRHNLEVCYPVPAQQRPDGLSGPGFQIMIDELKVEGRMRWDSRNNMILGVFREHSEDFVLEFLGMEQAELLQEGLAANKVHLASEATVVAVNSFSDVPSQVVAHPFIISPTCKREGTVGQKSLLDAAMKAVNSLKERIGGRLYCISSDGDSTRRAAMLLITFIRELDRDGELYEKLGELPLFDYHCGECDVTGNMDPKHVCKRFRNSLIRLRGSMIDGVVITRPLLKQHLIRDSRHSALHCDQMLNPNDRQNVKLMYDLLSSIAVLPEPKETDSPTFQNNRRVLRLLGAFYRHILEAYTNITLSLHQQLTHISAAMHLMMAIYQKEAGKFIPSQTYFDFMTTGKFWIISPGSDPLELEFAQVRTMTRADSNADTFQLGSRVNAAMHCDNILAEHPDWTRGPRRLRMPVWEEVAGDVSTKIDHISPRSWIGDVRVANVSCKSSWFAGRQEAERELSQAGWDPPFKSMESTGGFSIFCPFGKNEVVLLGSRQDGERDEDDEDRDIPTENPSGNSGIPGVGGESTSDDALLPDLDDIAQETVVNIQETTKIPPEPYLTVTGSTIKQHKATILRIFSNPFSVAESRDRLKRVRGFSRHTDSVAARSAHSTDAIPGEPMVFVEDPAALLVRSNGFVWLAVVTISSIVSGSKQVESLPKRLFGEPNVRAKIQIMELERASESPAPDSEEGDWQWTGKFVGISANGASKICEVDGSLLQLLNPAVLPAQNLANKRTATYHFKSVELVAIAAEMELSTKKTTKLPDVAFTSSFPYRAVGGYACFVRNRSGLSLVQEQGLCDLCPTASLSLKRPTKLVEHMAAHILFDKNPSINRDDNPCGFCLSTKDHCSIVLIRSKGSDGATRIDTTRSRCPNVANLGLTAAANSSQKNPCTNRPMVCPVSPCPSVVWKYNLKLHIQTVHPTARLSNYKSYYQLAEGEEVELKRISTTKKRKSSKKKIDFRISPQHSTEAALGEFSSLDADGNEDSESDEESEGGNCSSRSRSPDLPSAPTIEGASGSDSSRLDSLELQSAQPVAPEAPRPTLRPLSPDNDAEMLPVTLLPVSSQTSPVSRPAEDGSATAEEADGSLIQSAQSPDNLNPAPNLNVGVDEDAPVATRRQRRTRKKPNRRQIMSSDDDDEPQRCSAPNCTIVDTNEQLAHLCCVGLHNTGTLPEWYCDDDCRENAGQTVRKRRRINT
ncbi:hypothetical protein R3P38DRAFT_2809893 [Favolaschia claudopus]|uniref:Uncharacterized protein n=1 Tax=Favolaschia claudopus TaxID=2862362 RepID=A0AAV9ZCP4_9AGAR